MFLSYDFGEFLRTILARQNLVAHGALIIRDTSAPRACRKGPGNGRDQRRSLLDEGVCRYAQDGLRSKGGARCNSSSVLEPSMAL